MVHPATLTVDEEKIEYEDILAELIETETGDRFRDAFAGNVEWAGGDINFAIEQCSKAINYAVHVHVDEPAQGVEDVDSYREVVAGKILADMDIGPDQLMKAQSRFSEATDDHVVDHGDVPRILSQNEADDYTSSGQHLAPSYLDVERRAGFYVIPRGDDEEEFDLVASFVLDVNAFLESDDGEIVFDLTVRPSSNEESAYKVVVPASVFTDTQKFAKEVCKGRTTTFEGGRRELSQIKQLIGHQQAPQRIGVDTVGIHDGEMVTPNGVIGEDWKVDDPDNRFRPQQQAIETKWDLPVDGDGDYDSEEVAEIVRTLWKTRDTERFLPMLGYWYSSLLAPEIRQIEGELPLLTAMADTGAGKTSVIGMLYKLIGMNGSPFSAKDTKFALMNNLSSSNNVPIWLDEYKPSDMSTYQVDNLQDFLRKTTRRGDETRGNADQTVNVYTLEAPVVLSGEESIQGAAEQRRAIRTQLRTSVTSETNEYVDYWRKLNTLNPDEHAKAVWQYVLGLDDFESRWTECRKEVMELLEDEGLIGIDDLEITALTMIRVGVSIYKDFGKQHGVEEAQLPSTDDLDEATAYIAHKMGDSNRTSHIDEFIGLVADAIDAGYIEADSDFEDGSGAYTVVHEGKPNEQLRLKLEKAHHAVSKYINDHNLSGIDLLDSARDYKKRMKEDVPYVEETSIPTTGLGRCVSVSLYDAETAVDGFERGKVIPEAYYDEE